jgi:hypothetical protein
LAIEVVKLLVKLLMKLYQTGPKYINRNRRHRAFFSEKLSNVHDEGKTAERVDVANWTCIMLEAVCSIAPAVFRALNFFFCWRSRGGH